MSELSKLGEALIDEAIEAGKLTPPEKGAEIDLDGYFAAPANWRMGFSLLKGQGFTPPEIELLKKAEVLEARLEETASAAERLELRREIEELRVRFQMALERLRG